LGLGFWGLGLGVWAQTPNPQSPIPNPQSPFKKIILKPKFELYMLNKLKCLIKINYLYNNYLKYSN